MSIAKGFVRAFVGLLFGLCTMFALTPALAAFRSEEAPLPAWSWLILLAGLLLCAFAPTMRRALGRGFLLLGAAVFALPLSTILLSGRVTSDIVSGASDADKAATAIGSGIASVMATGAAAFLGFFLGLILLIVGLALTIGGRREVMVVDTTRSSRVDPRL